ncbi:MULTISPECIES: hypothetical protein [unclassified Mesorhizobium]|uniref:hypothetical protein n=1 Tax=unclassified Mesorhizobium TaxID=325217 RepID=UPI0015E27F20|nr:MULTISPECIES: hypothetical protein [unclassified Mesorhizobium]
MAEVARTMANTDGERSLIIGASPALIVRSRHGPNLDLSKHNDPRAAIIALKMGLALDTLKNEDVPARSLEKAIDTRKKHRLN